MATNKSGGGASDSRADKSVQAFREALERSVTLSRERIQEVADDAVSRGRITRNDANDLVSKLVDRGRGHSEGLLRDLESLVSRLREGVEERAGGARKKAERALDAVREATEEPLAKAEELRQRVGVGSDFPISGYDSLTAAEIKQRLAKLDPTELQKVLAAEKKGKARKGILADIAKRLS